ncbi:MAG TPA: MFS transporter [Acidimicrobiales bacterium]|nr:MFS transporter [Acidimicrobiales bacterium]
MALASLRPLRRRSYALVWSAALVSNVGSWMQTIAVGVLVTARTGRSGWTGLVAAAAFLPIGLLSPIGGALADRVDRRRWLITTTVGETVFATALAVAVGLGHAGPGLVTLLVFGGGAMAAIGFPAYQAMLPDLVPPEELLAAVSLSSAQFNLGRVVGPALAGVVIAAAGYGWAFAINAASFVAVIVALLAVRLPPVRTAERAPLRRRLMEGARATAAEPGCRLAVGMIAVVAVTASPFIALVPAVAVKLFHSGSRGTAVLVTAQGVGAVAGALALAPLAERFGRRRVLPAALFGVCAAMAGYAVAPGLSLSAMAIVVLGGFYICVLSGLNTTIQLRAPVEVRGRILGIYMMALGVLYPVGAIAQGWVADRVGLRVVTLGGAAVLAVVVAARLSRMRTALAEMASVSEADE